MLIQYPSYGADDLRYAYCVGRIRVLETRLLTKERLHRMAEARDADETLKFLQDTEYGPYLSEIASASQYELLLDRERRRILNLFLELSLHPLIDELFLSRYDFHNLKVLVKSKIVETGFDFALSHLGSIPVEGLKELFSEERYDKLPQFLQDGVERAISAYYPKKDPRLIDIAVDKSMFGFHLRTAERVKNLFLIGLIKMNIDLVNLLTSFRFKWLKETKRFLEETLIDGGYVEGRFLTSVFEEPWENLARKFFLTPYLKIVGDGGGYLLANSSFLRLERLCDDHRIWFMQRTKLLCFGVEPLIAYLLVKENEIRSLRMILVGKLNQIAPALIKERLPITF